MSNVGWSSSSNRPFHVCGSEFLFLLWFLLVLTADVRLFLSKSVPPLTFRCVLSELQEIWWAFQWMSGFSEGTKRRGDITNILWRPHTNSHNQYFGPNTACLVLYWLTVSSESCNREENLMRIFVDRTRICKKRDEDSWGSKSQRGTAGTALFTGRVPKKNISVTITMCCSVLLKLIPTIDMCLHLS